MQNTLMVQEVNTMVDGGLVVDLTTARNQYSSLVATTKEEKVKFFNATNSEALRLGDMINEVIEVRHIYCEEVECTNEQTGVVEICPRVVLITEEGTGYTCVSRGVFSSLKKLISIFGEPSQWEEAITIKVKQITKGEKKILTLALV